MLFVFHSPAICVFTMQVASTSPAGFAANPFIQTSCAFAPTSLKRLLPACAEFRAASSGLSLQYAAISIHRDIEWTQIFLTTPINSFQLARHFSSNSNGSFESHFSRLDRPLSALHVSFLKLDLIAKLFMKINSLKLFKGH